MQRGVGVWLEVIVHQIHIEQQVYL